MAVHPDSSDEELMEHLRGGQGGRVTGSAGGDEVGGSSSGSSEEEDDEEEEEGGGGLSAFEDSKDEEFKLVLVVRTDIGMQKGM